MNSVAQSKYNETLTALLRRRLQTQLCLLSSTDLLHIIYVYVLCNVDTLYYIFHNKFTAQCMYNVYTVQIKKTTTVKCKVQKELAHTTVCALQLILFSKSIGAF
jgi:hypothetical protein